MAQATEFYTTVQNYTTSRKFFGFLPPHGKWLNGYEKYSFWGDIHSWLSRYTVNGRAIRSFESCIGNTLAVLQTPAVHLQDETTGDVKVVIWDSGVQTDIPVMSDPLWGNYASSSETE